MNRREFEQLAKEIRDEQPGAEVIREAAARVRSRLEREIGDSNAFADFDGALNTCLDFQAARDAYRAGRLNEARRLLVEDHLHSCVACRRFFQGASDAANRRPSLVTMTPKRPSIARKVVPYAIAAAILAAMGLTLPPVLDRVFAPSGARGTVASVAGELYRVSDQGLMPLATGAQLNEHDEIRTAKASHAVLKLRDGSRIEMAERSALTVSEHWSGKTLYLDRGALMIEAAKQHRGRLEVVTQDCSVSVKGTIFEVTRGTKGSRVSVVEGAVKVDREGDSKLLHRGDQTTTSAAMTATSVASDVAWSENSAKYLALLGEFSAIQQRISALPGPGLRYQSKLAGLLPENTAIFASIPNLAPVLGEADQIFEDRVAQSPVLREWWNQRDTQELRAIAGELRTFGDYLGEEVVLAIPAVNGQIQDPLVIAEAKRPGLSAFLEQQFKSMKASNGGAPILISDPRTALTPTQHGPMVMVHGNTLAIGGSAAELARVASLVDSGTPGAFLQTPLWSRVFESYQSGAGWLFAADMEQILKGNVSKPQVSSATDISGLDNIRYLVIERKENLGRAENSAALSFSGSRHGLASWLADPGPMGTLEFISPDATFSASFVVKNPAIVLQELLNLGGADAQSGLETFQQQTGINLVNDIAANLGGEVTVAVDGPLLPTPSWKVAIEVDNPARIEWAIEQGVAAAQHDFPDSAATLTTSDAGGLTYHTLKAAKLPVNIVYVFTDGYMLIAPEQSLLEASIENRASGLTLARSAAFRAQLPQDGHANFSALLYYNLGSTVGPVIDQLKKGGLMTPDQEKSASNLVANREPGMIYAYGEPDRIVVASRSGFFGLNLDTLIGVNAKGLGELPQLLPLGLMKQ